MPSPLPMVACRRTLMAGAFLVLAAARAHADAAPAAQADRVLPDVVALYRELHAAPELSRAELATAARLARELKARGFEVTENVGRYAGGRAAHGVVGVLRNGAGPTLLIRADMDALPVEEKTGLPYASRVRAHNDAGVDVPVMHACGHDVHVSALVGVAGVMSALRDRWHGTLVLLGQPSEETLDGAQALLADGLYARFPRPDVVLALHDTPELPAGKVGVTPGDAMATSTNIDVLVRGVGGHGSTPDRTRDPVVLAANIVMQLQTVVAREVSPFDQAVLTVGTIHGGAKRNIIPDEVKLELNLRAYREEVRTRMVESVARIVRAAALGAGVPEDRLPVVTVLDGEYAPVLRNDPAVTGRLVDAFRTALGRDAVVALPPVMASEDFGRLGLAGAIPTVMFSLGAIRPADFEAAPREGRPLPSLHSPLFAPDPEPTLRTGIVAMSAGALELLRAR